jgi:catalase
LCQPPSSAIRAPTCAAPRATGISGLRCREPLYQFTIVKSGRGISTTYLHVHGFGSHTFSFINA